jgi:hypothetical protein
MSGILSPKELSLISSAADDAKMDEERQEREKKAKQKKELQDAFMSQDLHPEVRDRVNQAVRRAACNSEDPRPGNRGRRGQGKETRLHD